MALDIAYSIEADDFIDADRAYDYFWSGRIEDKTAFLCPGKNCTAKVTCANLDKEIQDMRVVVHYKKIGKEHSEECEIHQKIPLNLVYEKDSTESRLKPTLDHSIVDQFFLSRPDSYYSEKIHDPVEAQRKHKMSIAAKKREARLREIGSTSKIYSVRQVVSRYIRYQKDGSLDSRRVNIKGMDTQYKSIFKCIVEQDIETLPDTPAIYYGWAYINRVKAENAYQVKFKNKLKRDDKTLTTTILVTDQLIENYKIKKLVSTRLKKIYEARHPTAFVFIYGKPALSKNGEYANFQISNLDLIDINYDCPFP
ncbi:hypothetical protein ACREYJ_15030 [Pseudomonas kribbensis]|uniref:hypothetical protein n=1 Tax=Pseudomonas kribbensis TaxID=1628086 RepID=UPI003D77C5B8